MAKSTITISLDPIADMLTRLRNGLASGASEVSIPYAKQLLAIAKILKGYHFIHDFKIQKDGFETILLEVGDKSETRAISSLKRISKPGRRVYVKAHAIPVVKGGQGLLIVSTSHGIMAGHEAKKRALGGEVLCEVS